MRKKALITGCGGQDGSYLAELLVSKGYAVRGLVRPGGTDRLSNLRGVLDDPNFSLWYGDILEPTLAYDIALQFFDEVYHLAAQSQVLHSEQSAVLTFETNATATLRLLSAIMQYSPKTKVYFAASSEMFGSMPTGAKAHEDYPLAAQSPYAAAKVAAHLACRIYRRKGMFVVSGIAFNHESRRRGANFVTRKLGLGVRRFKETGQPVALGDVEVWRDWHHAADTMRGAYLALQEEAPREYVFASGKARSVREFAQAVCAHFNVEYTNATLFTKLERRPWDVRYLCGDPSKTEQMLGWDRDYDFSALVEDVCAEE